MKIDSPLFDRIRVKPDQDRRLRANAPCCEWPGCTENATHRAPKGRLQERDYWRFCLDHVREYNQSYNFFAGMSDDAVARFQKDALTGHRPTWKMGLNGSRTSYWNKKDSAGFFASSHDPFAFTAEFGPRRTQEAPHQTAARPVRNAERKALDVLGLETDAAAADIKARFKVLVKQHHPDANGGDRSSEDKLRDIIQAYNYLKSVGFC